MARCVTCGSTTELFVSGVAQCEACLDKAAEAVPPGAERICRILKNDIVVAKNRAKAASAEFDLVTKESPSGLPHPDGVLRVRIASRAYAQARQDLQIAIRRLNGFVVNNTIPDDLA